jgi:hypothetical protein
MGEQRPMLFDVAGRGYAAMRFASDPEFWPAFAAWAEQHTPGRTWTEDDRQQMAADSAVLLELREALDA